ncbi:MAG: type IV toxin-antitoxin system AbiEi family antitoxin domain-containing protein [Microbacterium sp.]|uniref:type IV toxin-antitoxin system AbiEi family antitoxin domain-containing protein n=1 Tax=Microbacterium sp. TaxID=51671 RepID=UPI003A8B9555
MTPDLHVLTRADLHAAGMSRGAIDRALAAGTLVRARRNQYLPADAPDEAIMAVRIGGRLTCLSVLAAHGVFVRGNTRVHVHMARTAGRMRAAYDLRTPLARRGRRLQVLHWMPLRAPVDARATGVGVLDALIHSVTCQPWRDAVAAIDSAVHLGLVTIDELQAVFATLSKRYWRLLTLVDGRAESGPETLMRLLVRELGCHVDLQVRIDDVGRVDLLVDGWLVIECDSKEHHSSWAQQVKDRERDLALAARSYVTLRPTAHQILNRPNLVRDALRGALAARRGATTQARTAR